MLTQHVPRDDGEPAQEHREQHVQHADVRAAGCMQHERLDRRQPEGILAMNRRRDRRVAEPAIEVEELRLQRPVRESVIGVDRLLSAPRGEQHERHAEERERRPLDPPTPDVAPPVHEPER